jgi:hypothetical protein
MSTTRFTLLADLLITGIVGRSNSMRLLLTISLVKPLAAQSKLIF